MVARAIALSKLDYCNGLLCGTSVANLRRLQKVQNKLARIATGTARRAHVTPVLASLHWLPVQQQVTYKVATLIFKVRSSNRPAYLRSILQDYIPGRALRSTAHNLLLERRTKTTTGATAFGAVAPKLWNSLPQEVRNSDSLPFFQNNLKTYFFRQTFNSLTYHLPSGDPSLNAGLVSRAGNLDVN